MTDEIVESSSEAAKLDRASDVPLHRQLLDLLETKIKGGEWPPGTLVPREIDLATRYGVSRATMRQTFEALVRDGYVTRSKKRGTLVSQPKVEQDLSRFYSFARDMQGKGLQPVSFVLDLAEISPESEDAAIFQVDQPDTDLKIYHLRRLRVVAGEPLLIENTYLAFDRPINLYDYDWRVLPLYEVLEETYGVRVARAEEFLEPVNLEPAEAQLLGVRAGAAAFRVERLTYDADGRLFERRMSLIRGDRYRFHIELPQRELLNEHKERKPTLNEQESN